MVRRLFAWLDDDPKHFGGIVKSHVSDLVSIAHSVYIDAMSQCSMSPDTRDIDTISRRVGHEGIQFLTVTLSNFSKELSRALEKNQIDPSDFRAFRKSGSIPAFMQGMIGLVFNPKDGRIRNNVNIDALEGIRQVANTFKKLEVPYTTQKVAQATSDYLDCEHLCSSFRLGTDETQAFRSVSRACWSSILSAICVRDTIPKHGPGATADHISGNQKYADSNWHHRLEPYFPFYRFKVPNETLIDNWREGPIHDISEEQEQPVKVVFVPKDSKGPRTIAMEPSCMQYAQQSISQELVQVLERARLTSGHVNFTDQTVNQHLAKVSSIDRSYATIDLSSASDRIPWSVVKVMLDCYPELLEAVDACRSKKALLPNGDIITLSKFASMGSALCFPIEAMYFFTICTMTLLRKHNLPPTHANCVTVSRDVYVYGDDIVVKREDVDDVIRALQLFNCKVNTDKSFWNGNFRESCGIDAYCGYSVTPIYLRKSVPDTRHKYHELISWCATSNLFYKKGYWRTSDLLMRYVEKKLGKLPLIKDTCSGLGKFSFQHLPDQGKWNVSHQVRKVRTWVPTPIYRRDKLDGIPALMKCLLRLERISCAQIDDKHLERTARRNAVTLKRCWITPY